MAFLGAVSGRAAWGTVREDYSAEWRCLELFSARSRTFARLSLGRGRHRGNLDLKGRLCFALALWNGRDPFLKERLFGVTGDKAITARM